jgi:hypothetical protein
MKDGMSVRGGQVMGRVKTVVRLSISLNEKF